MVVADTRQHARDAAAKVTVDIEELPAALTYLEAVMPDAVRVHEDTPNIFAEQPVDQHIARLPHAVGARDGLILYRRLELRLAENHNARRLDIQSRAAGLNLRCQYRSRRRLFKGINDLLPFRRRHRTINGRHASSAQKGRDLGQRIQEKGENQHLPAFTLRFPDQLQHPVCLG